MTTRGNYIMVALTAVLASALYLGTPRGGLLPRVAVVSGDGLPALPPVWLLVVALAVVGAALYVGVTDDAGNPFIRDPEDKP